MKISKVENVVIVVAIILLYVVVALAPVVMS